MNHREIERWYRLKNIKIASQAMVVICVVLIGGALFASRYLRPSSETFQNSANPGSGINIDNFVYFSPGVRPWELKAVNAIVTEALDKVYLKTPIVVYQGGKGNTVQLTANTGELDKKTSCVSGKGEVVIRYKDFRFSAGEIDYNDQQLRAKTSSPVSLEGGDMKLTGKGMSFSLEKEELVIEEDVKALLYDIKWVSPGRKLPI